jgi:hypothetical protein
VVLTKISTYVEPQDIKKGQAVEIDFTVALVLSAKSKIRMALVLRQIVLYNRRCVQVRDASDHNMQTLTTLTLDLRARRRGSETGRLETYVKTEDWIKVSSRNAIGGTSPLN